MYPLRGTVVDNTQDGHLFISRRELASCATSTKRDPPTQPVVPGMLYVCVRVPNRFRTRKHKQQPAQSQQVLPLLLLLLFVVYIYVYKCVQEEACLFPKHHHTSETRNTTTRTLFLYHTVRKKNPNSKLKRQKKTSRNNLFFGRLSSCHVLSLTCLSLLLATPTALTKLFRTMKQAGGRPFPLPYVLSSDVGCVRQLSQINPE